MMHPHPSLFQYLWDGLMVGVCLVDHEGAITQMNVSGSRLLGWGTVCPRNLCIEKVFEKAELDGEKLENGKLLLDRLKEKRYCLVSFVLVCVDVKGYGVRLN